MTDIIHKHTRPTILSKHKMNESPDSKSSSMEVIKFKDASQLDSKNSDRVDTAMKEHSKNQLFLQIEEPKVLRPIPCKPTGLSNIDVIEASTLEDAWPSVFVPPVLIYTKENKLNSQHDAMNQKKILSSPNSSSFTLNKRTKQRGCCQSFYTIGSCTNSFCLYRSHLCHKCRKVTSANIRNFGCMYCGPKKNMFS